ncbi:MAG: phosphoribosyl-AMP cyclohydrolase [Cellvibrionaceae bacterium]|nr:phosphoribosyl-AMP cyclohydrolase [Cellvibrionaceae bacterium]
MIAKSYIDEIKWNSDQLVPVIAQDHLSGKILMMAWMNPEALAATVDRGVAVYWSRSRRQLWRKGESSGHTQRVMSIHLDCDADAVILKVEQQGGIACHTGRQSCFYRELRDGEWTNVEEVLRDPKEIYS